MKLALERGLELLVGQQFLDDVQSSN